MKFTHIVSALALLASSASFAAPVTYNFTGTVDDSTVAGQSAGDAVSGQFTYDTDAAPAAPITDLGDGFQLATFLIEQPGALSVTIGGQTLTSSVLNVAILDNVSGDGGEALSLLSGGLLVNGQETDGALGLNFMTSGSNRDVFSSSLPANMQLSDFDAPMYASAGSLFVSLSNPDAASTNFTVTSLSRVTSAVPEASTGLTLMTGLFMMGGLLRQRRTRA